MLLEKKNKKLEHKINILNPSPYKKKEFFFKKSKTKVNIEMYHSPYQTNFSKLDKKTSYLFEHGENILIFFQSGKIVYFKTNDLIEKKVKFFEIKNNIFNGLIKDNEQFFGVKNIL